MSTYTDLIAKLATDRPWGYRQASDITLDADQLGAIVADTDDEDVMEEVLKNSYLLADLRDQVNASAKPEDMAGALGALVMRYVEICAQGRVFLDVRREIWRREDEESEAAENASSAESIGRAIDDLDRTAPL